jgi:hypothetical protein
VKERTTQVLLAIVALLLLAHLVRPALTSSASQAQQVEKAPAVLRAQEIELVDKKGLVVGQLRREGQGEPCPQALNLPAENESSEWKVMTSSKA